MKKKKNSKKVFIILFLIVLLVTSVFLLFINKGGESKELVLSCYSKEESNQYLTVNKITNVYEEGKDIIYNDSIEITKLTANEKVNQAVDLYFKANSVGKFKDYITYKEEENKVSLTLNVNLSNLEKDEVESLFGLSEVSIVDIKNYLEKGELICEEY